MLADFNCITTTTPMRKIHPLLIAKKIPFTYSKPQVIRLMSQIHQRHSPKDRLSQQGRTQTSLHVRAIWSRAIAAKHRHRWICKPSLLKWKHWPSTEGGTHGSRPVVYRTRILAFNPAGCLNFFGFGWIGYRFPFNQIRIRIIQMK